MTAFPIHDVKFEKVDNYGTQYRLKKSAYARSWPSGIVSRETAMDFLRKAKDAGPWFKKLLIVEPEKLPACRITLPDGDSIIVDRHGLEFAKRIFQGAKVEISEAGVCIWRDKLIGTKQTKFKYFLRAAEKN